LGKVEIYVSNCAYEPSEDTDMIIDSLKKLDLNGISSVLDLGTGSGIIAKILREILHIPKVVATDISPYAIACAKQNLKQDELLVACNAATCFKDRSFDLVILNPPYLSPSPEDEFLKSKCKGWLLRSFVSSLKDLEILCLEALRVTRILALIVYSNRSPLDIIECAESEGFEPEILQRKKFFFEELKVIGAWRK